MLLVSTVRIATASSYPFYSSQGSEQHMMSGRLIIATCSPAFSTASLQKGFEMLAQGCSYKKNATKQNKQKTHNQPKNPNTNRTHKTWGSYSKTTSI